MTRPDPETNPENADTRCGYVALLGPPNAGKSTLMNALIGERLSIVTAKAQTTWQRVTGILTTDRTQMIFLDTPGLLEPNDLLQRAMLTSAREALGEADVVLLVLDGSLGLEGVEAGPVQAALADRPQAPLLAAVNKIDLARDGSAEAVAEWVSQELGGEPFLLCALDRTGVGPLLEGLTTSLPDGPFLYPEDEIARDPVRFFVAEMIRETVFEDFRQEIPYSVFTQIEEFREDEDPIFIQAHIFVERKSQKGILIGKKGSSIRKLGSRSREKIEDFLGRRVYLDLWIKVLPDWRRKRGHLRQLGFPVPETGSET
ncbi:MAG: GTPase Era [Gemmatimonadota bacterium]|jgi:GTP-binding protein Era